MNSLSWLARPGWRRLLVWWGVLACLLPASPRWARADHEPVAEYALKSTLYFKLPQFVYLNRAERGGTFNMCLLGSNPFGGAIDRLVQAPIDGRPAKFLKLAGAADAQGCHFVFVTRSEASNLDSVLRHLDKFPVVTVSDIDGFAKAGGMVEMALGDEGAAVRILLNRKAAQRQNIEFNAQLLRLSRVVEP